MLQPIKYSRGFLQIIDQLRLPLEVVYIDIVSVEDGYYAIKDMKVRGAPAIAIVAALSLAVEIWGKHFESTADVKDFVHNSLDTLVKARPTAVNIFRAASDIKRFTDSLYVNFLSVSDIVENVVAFIENLKEDDVKCNIAIGDHGAKHICDNVGLSELVVLTHCNTGSLATAGYGTALGVVRSLHKKKVLKHVVCTETRPFNQGSRLTAFELSHDNIDATLIVDSAVAFAMKQKNISAVVVGADRIAINGDTANKIGTYQIAILAKFFNIPFYVAAPTTSICRNAKDGQSILIEERNTEEITHFQGKRIAAEGVNCWNPAFDITPAELITGGIITEYGVFKPVDLNDEMNKLK
ncbi:methylthioribose-1-phosphate isomerase [Hydra vulgaris]|uniref:Methylthioribose-1-phosphate isomerase n=1 Tax=Hydra vulgaris TaxID=6087 RepID=T2M6S5_HYDVU|nr:methylthioribose-1-phosphate isomerase [Hydra vulgaris]